MQVQCKTMEHVLHVGSPIIVPTDFSRSFIGNSIPLLESEQSSSSVKERWSRKDLTEAKQDAKYCAA